MIIVLIVGFAMTLLCLGFQALASALAVRYFAEHADDLPPGRRPRHLIFLQFSALMIILMAGNVVQIVLWAIPYRIFGDLADFEEALYFSGVTFTSLGYGDVTLHGKLRLLTPLQAANGLMMFGVTTAVFIAAVQRAIAMRLSVKHADAPTD